MGGTHTSSEKLNSGCRNGLYLKKKKKVIYVKTKNACPICSEVPKQRDGLSNLALKVGQKEKMILKYGSTVERV